MQLEESRVACEGGDAIDLNLGAGQGNSVPKSVEGIVEQLKLPLASMKTSNRTTEAGDHRFDEAQPKSCAGIVITGLGTSRGAHVHIGGVTINMAFPPRFPLIFVFPFSFVIYDRWDTARGL